MDTKLENLVESDIETQLNWVKSQLEKDKLLMSILKHPKTLELNAWLGAGCINQRIWNILTNREITFGIKDYDLVYFDSNDITEESQQNIQEYFNNEFPNIEIECVNEARVHLWYKDFFESDTDIKPYTSVENAVKTWPSTASAIAVQWKGNDLKIFAPYGLSDLLNLTVKPNLESYVTETYFEKKVKKWIAKWPELKVFSS